MSITIIFLIVLFVQLSKTTSPNRKVLSVIALCVYLFISLSDLYYLEMIEHISFHPSDPTIYNTMVKNLSLGNVLKIESSNIFYYIINWMYEVTWGNETVISFFIKINNVLITVCTYLLLTKKLSKVSYIDCLLLFNPYTIMTLIRNVRDMYIVLFIVIIIIGLGVIKENKLNVFWTLLAVGLLAITRFVLLGPILVIYWLQYKHIFSLRTRWIFYTVVTIFIFIYLQDVIQVAANQMIGTMEFIGEDFQILLPLVAGGLSLSILFFLFQRIFIGLVSFMFTPHPVNFISKWLENMDHTGMAGIYTGVDNFLISLGSVFNYLFVIPVVIAFWFNWKKVNKCIFIFVLCYVLLYVISYLGVTDIRNRNTAIFFILAGVLFADEPIKMKRLYYILSICIFIGLLFVSY